MGDYRPRSVTAEAVEMLAYFPVLKIQGARQVGKSTLVKKLIEHDDSASYFTLDEQASREFAARDPEGFIAQSEGKLMVLDEVQRNPEITLAVKKSVDDQRESGRFILTGSSNLDRAVGAKDSLAGRCGSIRLRGFTFGERRGYAQVKAFVDRVLNDELQQPADIVDREAMAHEVHVGGYPTVQEMSEKYRRTWFDTYLKDVVGVDVKEEKMVRDPSRLMKVLKLLSVQQGQELVMEKLARESSVSASTIPGYLEVLKRLYLVETIPPFERNLLKREVGRHKILISDSGLAANLARMSEKQWLDDQLMSSAYGHALEAALAAELLAQRDYADNRYDLYHWRTRDGVEVDLVLELDDGKVIAIEVKAGAAKGRHFNPLERLRDAVGDRFIGGFVVCRADEARQFGDRLMAIPWSCLWS